MFRARRWERPSVVETPPAPLESLLLIRLRALWDRTRRFWDVFRQNRLGMAGLAILLMFTAMAILAPFLTGLGWLRPSEASLCGTDFHICTSTDPTLASFRPPSAQAFLGTDQLGRDIFARLWWGTQMTMLIGVAATIISMGLGTFIGMIAGYYGGWVDEILMRIVDFFLVLPTLVLSLVLAGIFIGESGGGSVWTVVWIIGISLWSSTARLVRSQVLSLKQRQFIERAKAVGASENRIVWYHIFPNAFSLVFAEAILTVAVAILTESFLSFLGLGPSGAITWGKMIDDAIRNIAIERRLIWWIFSPGFAIVLVVLGFTLLGYALDEIFNPRLRKR